MQSHDSDPVYHVHNHVVPRLRCRIRMRSLTRSMASVLTRFCIVVGRIPCGRGEGLCHQYLVLTLFLYAKMYPFYPSKMVDRGYILGYISQKKRVRPKTSPGIGTKY
jgi:hypothetical protein